MEAADVGLGIELGLAALEGALCGLNHLPRDIYLAINLSPDALLSGLVPALLDGILGDRIVLEVNEHAVIKDVVGFRRALEPLRGRARIAIDNAGAGYSGLRQILDIGPEIIKLDMSLTRNIDADPAQAELTRALITFARDNGSKIVAEGIETAPELATLRLLGADFGQGYFLQRPKPISALSQFLIERKFGRVAEGEEAESDATRPERPAAGYAAALHQDRLRLA